MQDGVESTCIVDGLLRLYDSVSLRVCGMVLPEAYDSRFGDHRYRKDGNDGQ